MQHSTGAGGRIAVLERPIQSLWGNCKQSLVEHMRSHRIDLIVAEAEDTKGIQTAEGSEIRQRVIVEVKLLQRAERQRWKYLNRRGVGGGRGGGRALASSRCTHETFAGLGIKNSAREGTVGLYFLRCPKIPTDDRLCVFPNTPLNNRAPFTLLLPARIDVARWVYRLKRCFDPCLNASPLALAEVEVLEGLHLLQVIHVINNLLCKLLITSKRKTG